MTDWGPFMSYWGTYCKDVFQNAVMGSDTRIIFSEGLLRTLYYETDVGCIPRGIKLDSKGTAPKFTHKKNWNKQIQGCYWCQDDNNTFQGICCTRDCFYFLHEWCIERAMHFTRNRFCRLPGCDIVTYNDNIYCDEGHLAKFDCTFPKWTESKSASLKSALRAGPIWYQQDQDSSKKTPSESNTHPQSNHTYNLRNKSTSNSTQFKCRLPLEFRSILIHQTDIGVVPRTCPSQEDLTSKYSQCPNWSAVIKGCYYCRRPEMKDSMTGHFCRLRCYLLFYEWCRSKVESMVRIRFCRYPECTRKAAKGFQCCTRDHTVNISDLYKDNKIINIEQIISFAPKWYIKSDTPHELVPHLCDKKPLPLSTYLGTEESVRSQTLPLPYNDESLHLPVDYEYPFDISQTNTLQKNLENELQLSCKSSHVGSVTATTDTMHDSTNTGYSLRIQKSQSLTESTPQYRSRKIHPDIYPFSLSNQLTHLLSQYTDVDVIPRHSRAPHAPVPSEYASHTNWGAEITGCYWCQLSNSSFHELTCSRRCWLLFHEWCVRKIETSCGARLCALPGCENSRPSGCMCCSLEHIKDITELRGSAYLTIEDEVELTLGPNWYSDLSPIHFSRTGAFYEFSIYFPSLVILEGSIWPSVYHYLCAQKLVGTPYSNHISRMECVKELEIWMKRRTCAKWVRADWCDVCERDTYRAAFAKFQQNSVLRGLLLRTGRRPLVCRDSSLGDVLVGLREIFRTQRFIPKVQLGASITSACNSINDTLIASKTPVTPAQERVKESLPIETSVESIPLPEIHGNQPVSGDFSAFDFAD